MCKQRSIASDQELLQNYNQGDNTALSILVKRYKTKVYSQIMMFVRDTMTAEDLYQDTLIKAIETLKMGKYNDEGKFGPWLSRIAYNLCIDHFRKNKRMPPATCTEDFDIFDVLGHSEQAADEKIIKQQRAARIRALVDKLPAEQKEVVLLRHFADLSFKEISALTQVSINTALGRMRYALINIRRMVEEKQLVI